MLQIITGKFFRSPERLEHPAKGVLYSNYSWIAPIETCVGSLEPVEPYRGAATQYVFSYVNQLEKEPPRAGGLVRVGDSEILRQFQLLCMFGLRAYFASDRSLVVEHCRKMPTHGGVTNLPSRFVPRLFNEQIHGTKDEVEVFPKFVDKVLALPRARYRAVMAVFDNLEHALLALNWNVDLAYSILVYCLESLSQGFDGYVPRWEDYGTRSQVDEVLANIEPRVAQQVRDALLQGSFLKLQGRVIEFTLQHLAEEHFAPPRMPENSWLRRSEMARALRNAYKLRSEYSHSLEPIHEHLRHADIASHEVVHWEREPFLTFGGLFRIVEAVVREFISRSPALAFEELNWRTDLPGIIKAYAAPQYWVWKADGIEKVNARELAGVAGLYFGGFLGVLVSSLEETKAIANMHSVLTKFLARLPQASSVVRRRVVAMVALYNSLLREDLRMEGWRDSVDLWQREMSTCSIEAVIANIVIRGELGFTRQECEVAYEQFGQVRFSKSGFELPPVLELWLLVELANAALADGDADGFRRFITVAIGDAGSRPTIQATLLAARVAGTRVEPPTIFPFLRSSTATERATSGSASAPTPPSLDENNGTEVQS